MTGKRSARQADAVVVSSKLEFEDALAFGIPKTRLHVIPMGIDIPADPVERNGDQTGPWSLLFLGRVARVRRVELLLQAASRLRFPWRLTIVGGEEKTSSLSRKGYLDELKRLALDLKIQDRVTFTGPRPRKELKSYYQSADVFVYPSRYENFGQPVLEAAAWGLPVIATSTGVASEIIREGETGFLTPPDPQAIAERIEELREVDPQRQWGRNLRNRVRENFAWDSVMHRYLELYRSLL